MEINNLKVYLATIGMSLREFAEIVDCNYKYLSTVSQGKIPVGKRLAKEICQATNGVISLPVAKKKNKTDHEQENQESPPAIG